MRKELLKGLTDEQIKKVEACKNPEEILALAKSEGVELNDEQLKAVTGGGCFFDTLACPQLMLRSTATMDIMKARRDMNTNVMTADIIGIL